jgi:hypothetical protein
LTIQAGRLVYEPQATSNSWNAKEDLMSPDPDDQPRENIHASAAEEAQALESHRHPLNLKITSPQEAAEYLKHEGQAALSNRSLVSAQDEPRRWWLTGGAKDSDYYALNWSGPLDSKWDWVSFVYRYYGGLVIACTIGRWQWACNGSPYVTSQTPGGWMPFAKPYVTDPSLDYFIWDAERQSYKGSRGYVTSGKDVHYIE